MGDFNQIIAQEEKEGGSTRPSLIHNMKKKRMTRFEEMWIKHPNCKTVINRAWNFVSEEDIMKNLFNKIRVCRKELANWNKIEFGHVGDTIKEIKTIIEVLQARADAGERSEEIKQAKSVLNDLLQSEETMWKQHSRNLWLKSGDKNTLFFHSKANQRRKRNLIEVLKDEDGI
ncbi:hypothetical protein CFOL_v3_20880 [Cephalotus follicularis]|uniref:Uncharacterized protein n=1 Tax=Cephalotus follicularis TaxID=3775 RepID=A0A1Q3CAY9_CEPFO|nr:hypothetical protein CFOL_v3_20880 [Cephalotus follicularis]